MRTLISLTLLTSGLSAAPVFYSGGFGATATADNQSLVAGQFAFRITNTSASGSITSIGFDLPGPFPATYTMLPIPNFSIMNDAASAPASAEGDIFDFAILTGASYGNGVIANGIGPGGSATFVVNGDFTGLTADLILLSMFPLFEDIGDEGDITVGEPLIGPADAPEPSTIAMIGIGLLAIGMIARHRKIRI